MAHSLRALAGSSVAAAIWFWLSLLHAEPAGFQLRGAIGGADVLAFKKDGGGPTQSLAVAADVYWGASPKRGVAIGGFFEDTAAPIDSQNIWILGPYVDYYPNPVLGLHLMGTAGLAERTVFETPGGSLFGWSLGAGGGYDLWAEKEWSCGLLVHLAYVSLQPGVGIIPGILFSLVYQ